MKYLPMLFILLFNCYAATVDVGDGVFAYKKGEYDKAMRIFKDLSKKENSADAQYNIATMYFYAKGVKPDNTKAFEWFEKAAKNGEKRAEFMLGFMLENGLGTEKNMKKSFMYYKKAADKDYAKALYSLGRFYENGIVVNQDKKKAKELYEKAASRGSVAGAYKMAKLLEQEGNYKKAIEWYKALQEVNYIPANEDLKKICANHKEYCK